MSFISILERFSLTILEYEVVVFSVDVEESCPRRVNDQETRFRLKLT